MSNTRIVSLGVVALLHVLLGYAFVSGLALKVVKKIVAPIEAVEVKEEAPPPDEPPPPPPKEQEIPPYVPPPDVSVQSDAPPPPTISVQAVQPQPQPTYVAPAPPVAAPPPPAPTGPTSRATPANARVFEVSEDDYPPSSLRAEEEGVTRVSVTIGANGRVEACTVVTSSNFPKLDERTCRIAQTRWRYKPALQNGTPVADTQTKNVRWVVKR